LKQVKKMRIYVSSRDVSPSDEQRFLELSRHLPNTEIGIYYSQSKEQAEAACTHCWNYLDSASFTGF
jgi:hypothetical protein